MVVFRGSNDFLNLIVILLYWVYFDFIVDFDFIRFLIYVIDCFCFDLIFIELFFDYNFVLYVDFFIEE